MGARVKSIDFVFDGPPGPEAGRFVEVEEGGVSISLGEWIERDDGFWALRVTPEEWDHATILSRIRAAEKIAEEEAEEDRRNNGQFGVGA